MVDSIAVKDAAGATITLQTAEKLSADLLAVIGVVGASPASNTVQDRLKTLSTQMTTLLGYSAPATTGAASSVAGSASSVALLASNAARKGAVIVNDSTAVLKVGLGFTASATAYSIELGPGASTTVNGFTGAINGIWASATGNARITELT